MRLGKDFQFFRRAKIIPLNEEEYLDLVCKQIAVDTNSIVYQVLKSRISRATVRRLYIGGVVRDRRNVNKPGERRGAETTSSFGCKWGGTDAGGGAGGRCSR